jgi:hypothetical protein
MLQDHPAKLGLQVTAQGICSNGDQISSAASMTAAIITQCIGKTVLVPLPAVGVKMRTRQISL